MKTKSILILLICIHAVGYSQPYLSSEFKAKGVTRKEYRKIKNIYTNLLDNVALYTMVGDIKPVSCMSVKCYTKYESVTRRNDKRVIKRTDELRQIVKKMNNEDLHFAIYNPQRAYMIKKEDTSRVWRIPDLLIMNKCLVKKAIKDEKDFFESIDINEDSNMDSIAKKVFIDQTCDSLNEKAQGLLFGYPKYAIDFFINADRGYVKNDRKPIKIPAYDKKSDFVFVVPIGHQLSQEDSLIIDKASMVLEKYKTKRRKYINLFKHQPYELYKEWSN
jgi:hypothetical protein